MMKQICQPTINFANNLDKIYVFYRFKIFEKNMNFHKHAHRNIIVEVIYLKGNFPI